MKKKVLVWETLATVSGGQKMTLTVMDLLAAEYEFCCLIPAEGLLSEELNKRKIPYILMGDQTLPTGVKGKKAVFRYGWMSVRNILKSLKAIVRWKPDVLYCPGPAALPWSAVCGALTGRPVIWHLHHLFQDGPTKKLLNFCSGWKAVKTVLAVSACVGSQLRNEKGREKVHVLYNPVDAEKYAGGNPSRIRQELGMDGTEGIVLGHIGLIQRAKRQDVTLAVLETLKKKGHRVLGLFPGECREPEFLEELQNRAAEQKLDARFLGRREDIPDLLAAMDVLLIPSVEGFPLAGMEAAAAGVPVAASDTAGTRELIAAGGHGQCYAENNAEAAAETILRILADREVFAQNGRRFAQLCSEGAYQAKLIKLFTETEL